MKQDTPKRRNFFLGIFVFFWRLITWTRILVLNLLFLAFIAFIFVSLNLERNEPQPDQSALVIAPSGNLVDQLSYASPESQLLTAKQNRPQETVVRDLVQVIEFAGNDSRITGLILKLDYLSGASMSKMQEVGRAIDKFKTSGKPVVATADNYTQAQYFLASYADEIYLSDMGHIAINGFGVYRNYFKQALDKISVKFHVFKVGEYKDFVEPYTRDSMSNASKEHNKLWLDELWGSYSKHVEKRRDFVSGRLTEFVNHMADQLETTEGNTAQLAFDMNLVDNIGSRLTQNKLLIEKFGSADNDDNEIRHVSYQNYSPKVLSSYSTGNANIGLIVASGNIFDGIQPEGSIGGDSLSQLIREARVDENIQALVLRIDSGGGSAFASEVIRAELQATRDSGKTVVVSMGSVAASGGYWIAMAADEVWATPTTITGSIGVFGLFPTIEKSLDQLGIHTDGVGTTNLAGAIRLDRPLSQNAQDILQQGVESIYSRFIKLVAKSRNKSPELIHKIAGGRVWTGTKAKELGLVDHLGYLDDAISSAADRAGIQNIQVKLIERKLSPKEQIIKELMKEASIGSLAQSAVSNWSGLDRQAIAAMGHILDEQKFVLQSTPSSTYALCMECDAP